MQYTHLSATQLQYNIHIVVVLKVRVESDDIGMLETAMKVNLTHDLHVFLLLVSLEEARFGNDFSRIFLVRAFVSKLVTFRKATFTE